MDAGYGKAVVAVAVVGLTVREGELAALVLRAGGDPADGESGLPRGRLSSADTLPEVAARLVATASGSSSAAVHLEQLGAYQHEGGGGREPVLDLAFVALAPQPATSAPGATARWVPVRTLLASRAELPGEDRTLLADGVERARATLEYSPAAAVFCPPEFTVGDLRRVYEAVWDAPLDPGNFHRKATTHPGFREATGKTAMRTCGRPGQTFRRGPATRLDPPLLRAAIG